jgi:hypothetical protein
MAVDLADNEKMFIAIDGGTNTALTSPIRSSFATDFVQGKYFTMPLNEVPN